MRTAGGDVFGPYHVIEYPDWVTIVAPAEGGCRLLLVREYRHGVGAVLTGLPGGLVDHADGELPEQAAKAAARRELREETGYGGGRWDHLATLHPNPSNQSNTAYCYLATDVSREALPQSAGAGEAQDLVEQDFVQGLAELRDGTLPLHAIHAAALWSAAARIAGDRTGQFGSLSTRLRRFLSGEANDPALPPLGTHASVGG